MSAQTKVKPKRGEEKPRSHPSKRSDMYWNWSKNGKPDPKILADIVRRVVESAKPEKILLFGSGARGTMGPNSDIDLLVIKKGKFRYWPLLTSIHRHLRGKGAPVDIVLVTAEDAERYRDTHCLVICPALKEGKVVYDSEAVSSGRSPRMTESRPHTSGKRTSCRVMPR